MTNRVLYWFRTDLRLHDSPALQAALNLSPTALFPVWCWDPNYVYRHRVGINRFRFLLESMNDTSSSLQQIQPNTQLLVVRGDPIELLPQLWNRWNITHLVYEKDPSAYGRRRDINIQNLAKQNHIKVVAVQGHHLYDPEEVVKKNQGKPTMTLASLRKIVEQIGPVPTPLDLPKQLPLPQLKGSKAETLDQLLLELAESLKGLPHYQFKSEIDLNSIYRKGPVKCYLEGVTGSLFSIPTLESLGIDKSKVVATIRGGEKEAIHRLDQLSQRIEYLATFSKPNTSPGQSTDHPSTTLLSPYLKFGCLSVRRLWWTVDEAVKKYSSGSSSSNNASNKKKKPITEPPENLHGQLLFRDMYACAEYAVGDSYSQIRGNPICRYMDWYLPTIYDSNGQPILPRPKGDDISEARLEAFRNGKTGFPWIDALMRQLTLEGWCHHLGRHSLASFLTRGQCWISWERGSEIFDDLLIDWDPASNPGNWMWLSCSAFFHQFFKQYGVITFPTKFDPHGQLVRQYCPELKKFPDQYIYQPHLSPLHVQKKANCLIGQGYPFPIVDEKKAAKQNLQRIKACYQIGLKGDDYQVMNGNQEIARQMCQEKHTLETPPSSFVPSGGGSDGGGGLDRFLVNRNFQNEKTKKKKRNDDDEDEEVVSRTRQKTNDV